MSENEFPATPLPKAAKAVTPNRFDEVSTGWRKKVAQGFHLSLIMGLLAPVWMGLVAWLAAGVMGKIIFYSWFCAGIPIGIYTLWLITTALPKSFGYMFRLGRWNRILVTGSVLISPALVAAWPIMPDVARKQTWLLIAVLYLPPVIMFSSAVVCAWYIQKLADLAGDRLNRRLYAFGKWVSVICFALIPLMLLAGPEITEQLVNVVMNNKKFLPDYVQFKQSCQTDYVLWFVSVICAYFSYLNWRLYKRIRVRPGPVEAEQFAGDVDDGQSFGG